MKHTLISTLTIAFLFAISGAKAQNCEIPLMVVIPDQVENMPEGAEEYLVNKLRQGIVSNGVAANADFAQFFIAPKISLVTKDIVPGPPTNIAMNMEITFYIADYYGEKIFSSVTINSKGVGTNETKAYINGIRNFNTKSPAIQKFIEEGKRKIIAYYDANYQNIIKKAQTMSRMKNYEEALFHLMSIPECSVGYNTAMKAAAEVYQTYVDYLCQQNLNLAKAAWVGQQNRSGAAEAAEYLANIYPDAKCYSEAMTLYKEIKSRIREEWNFVMKAYDDAVSLEKQRINAWKEVGVAYGRGQQPTSTHIHWIR